MMLAAVHTVSRWHAHHLQHLLVLQWPARHAPACAAFAMDSAACPALGACRHSLHLQGRYSAILAGAAFMDSAALFPAYWSPQLAPARALVDEVRCTCCVLLGWGLLPREFDALPAPHHAARVLVPNDACANRVGPVHHAKTLLMGHAFLITSRSSTAMTCS